ncbi:MAG: isoleucine--tRNA ligase [Spirochaetes bacterium]|nr:isoleucine--tRNA ligase [Spirochaetota bacterium]
MAFKDVEKQVNFPQVEESILKYWQEEKLFEKSVEQNKDKEEYIFYDGPPFATGLPHYGHILPGAIKDIVPRYQTMKGKYVPRRWGWDCHGLPVEQLIEQDLNISGKKEILNYGIDKFNEACRASVLKYTQEWEKTVDRMGRWVDFNNSYKTMDLDFMESIWWVFKSLWDKKLIYESFKILPFCARCTTPLSNFETNQGYKDVQDPAITVAFKLRDEKDTYILAWTTTPWTLPSNMGLAVGEGIEYVAIEDDGKKYIMAELLIGRYYKDLSKVKIVKRFKGTALKDQYYEPLFPFFKDIDPKAFRIVLGHHVSTESGTGIVHIAPGFGEDDAEIGKKEGLPAVCPVDAEGCFTEEITDYEGVHVKAADKEIIKRLKEERKLIKHETYHHSYPHCWRCDEPLIYKAVSSWFVDIQKIKDKMTGANQKINWVPEHIKNGRFGKWLEGARDWAISRNRYWGTPLPIWRCDDCGEVICVGSIEELEKLTGEKVTDLHKHFVDKLKFKCSKCTGTMERIEEVLDCWFESGAMPYAQNHYPFENKEHFERTFPADFIAEGLDQTRGWFYTLVVLGAALFDKNSFQNVVVNGLVLAEDGRKMSKRLKNYPEINYIFDNYGADALRLYLMNSAAVKAGELLFSEGGVKEVLKKFHLPLWNAYSFFITYAKVDNWNPVKDQVEELNNPLDLWLASNTEQFIGQSDDALGKYDFQRAIKLMYDYIDSLTNWYIRRSRRRFWKSEDDLDKKQAYTCLYRALISFCKVAAPTAPYLVEEIYQNLKTEDMPESVHLCDFPEENRELRNLELEREMELIIRTVEMGRSLRAKVGINLRKPLNAVYLVTKNSEEQDLLAKMETIIKEELNVKDVLIEKEEEKLVTLTCKPNFRVLGKKLGKNMKQASGIIAQFGPDEAIKLENGEEMVITIDGNDFVLNSEDVLVERNEKEGLTVLNEGTLTVALDTKLTKDLIEEGIAREFIRHIQNLRKEKNLDVVDRIKISYSAKENISEAINSWLDTIKNETLAVSIEQNGSAAHKVTVDEQEITIDLEKN